MRSSWTCWVLGMALLSVPSFALAEGGQKNASDGSVDDHIVAKLAYTKDSHLEDPCSASQTTYKIRIFSDGRVLQTISRKENSCRPDGLRQYERPLDSLESFPPSLQMSPSSLPEALELLQQAQKDLVDRAAQQSLRSGTKDRLLIATAGDSSGVTADTDLRPVEETGEGSEAGWESLKKIVEKYEVK